MQKVYVFSGWCNRSYYSYTEFYLTTNPNNFAKQLELDEIDRYEDVDIYISYILYQNVEIPDDNGTILSYFSGDRNEDMINLCKNEDDFNFCIPHNLHKLAYKELNLSAMYDYSGDNKHTDLNEVPEDIKRFHNFKDGLIMFCMECNVFYNFVCQKHPEICYLSL